MIEYGRVLSGKKLLYFVCFTNKSAYIRIFWWKNPKKQWF